MPFAKRSGSPSQIDGKLKTKRQKIIEEERIRVLRESLMLFFDKLMEKYDLIQLREVESKDKIKENESVEKEVIQVDRDEVEAFTSDYADTKPLGF